MKLPPVTLHGRYVKMGVSPRLDCGGLCQIHQKKPRESSQFKIYTQINKKICCDVGGETSGKEDQGHFDSNILCFHHL